MIRERHLRINLSGIDFLSLRGAKIPDEDDRKEEDSEPTDQEVSMDDQFGAGNGIRMVNPENPSSNTIPTVVGTTPSVSETTAVSAEAIPMV